MDKVDIVIIGAGIIGLSIASEIGDGQRDVYILEKNINWGQETSSRNSEVIHGGLYYSPGSFKAVSAVEGRHLLYEICGKHLVPYRRTGKIIVAVDEGDMDYIEWLHQNAAANGVDTKIIDRDEVSVKEPAVRCDGALYSPETGIVDTHSLMKLFLDMAMSKGVELVCEADVRGIEKTQNGYKVRLVNCGEEIVLDTRIVINCAGHNADKIAAASGIDIEKEKYTQIYSKGEYFRVSEKFSGKTNSLIYPVPNKKSLGIHTVLDLRGGVRLGPDEEEVSAVDYSIDDSKRKGFHSSVEKFLPEIREEWISPDMAGIRPQLKYSDEDDFRDFIVRHEDKKGLPGLINLIGIESPGITASPYIAKYVAKIVDKIL